MDDTKFDADDPFGLVLAAPDLADGAYTVTWRRFQLQTPYRGGLLHVRRRQCHGADGGRRQLDPRRAIPVLVGDYPPSAWLEREGWTLPTLVDDASSGGLAALGMSSFPGFVFVDGDGRVVQRYTGEMPAEAFDQVVRALVP